jgi:Ca2+-dependent lipid-binding protein
MVHATLGPMMYDPNVFTLNLEQLLSGVPLDAAIGVIQVTIEAARGLKANKIGGGSPDPYVSISINNRQELARTKYKESTSALFIVLLSCPYFYPQIQPNMDGDQVYSGQLPSGDTGA